MAARSGSIGGRKIDVNNIVERIVIVKSSYNSIIIGSNKYLYIIFDNKGWITLAGGGISYAIVRSLCWSGSFNCCVFEF